MFGNPEKFDKSWRDICSVEPSGADYLREMVSAHYLSKWPAITTLALGLWCGPFCLGMCIFADAPHQTSIRYGGKTWELARLWIHDDVPRNAETWLISKAVKHIKQHYPDIEYLVSYADPTQGHRGTIYKAANWTSDDRTDDERKSPRCDYVNVATGRKYSRWAHIPKDANVERVSRVSKYRFVYSLG